MIKGQYVGGGSQDPGAPFSTDTEPASDGAQGPGEVCPDHVDHRESSRQSDADVSGNLQSAELIFGVGDDRVESPATEYHGKEASKVLHNREGQNELDASIHGFAEPHEPLDHRVGVEVQTERYGYHDDGQG